MEMAHISTNQRLFDAFFDAKCEIDEESELALVSSSSRKVANHVSDMDDTEKELDISRDPQFYKVESVKIGPRIHFRVFFHPDKGSFFVFWRKKNDPSISSTSEDTHMLCPPHNIKSFRKMIREVTDEVAMTPWDDIPESHKCEEGSIEDKDNPMYWSPNIAKWLPDKSLAVRSYKTSTGYYVRILMARKYHSGTFPNWIGRSMSMRVPEARRFDNELERCEVVISEADKFRIELVKEMIKKRDGKQNETKSNGGENKVTFEDISPPDSPSPE